VVDGLVTLNDEGFITPDNYRLYRRYREASPRNLCESYYSGVARSQHLQRIAHPKPLVFKVITMGKDLRSAVLHE